MWEDYYGWGGPQQYDWGAGFDPTGNNFSTYSSYDPITLPTQFWPDQSTYDATTAHMASLGITNAPRGTLDPNVTSAYGQATYNQPSWMDDPLTPAMIMMGGAALGGGFANGGAGYGAAGGGLSPMTTGGATMLPGGTGQGVAAVNAAMGGAPMASMPSFGSLGGALGDGLSEITVGAQRLPGGLDSLGGGGMWDNIMGGMSGNWGSLIGGLLGYADARSQPDSMTTNQGGNSASQYFTTFPDEIAGPARDALSSLRGLYGNGYQVAGANPASMAAISGLQGFAGGGGINPYLDSVFNSAADSTRTRLASEFARSGRNIQASAPARSEELQHLAAGIYGPGHEAERQRQFSSLLPLLGAGDYMRGIEQQRLDAPYTALDRYLGGLGGLMPFFPGTQNQTTQQTGAVTQPLFNNPLAGFLGGAQLGSLFTQG
jgi:hypothetical protein